MECLTLEGAPPGGMPSTPVEGRPATRRNNPVDHPVRTPVHHRADQVPHL